MSYTKVECSGERIAILKRNRQVSGAVIGPGKGKIIIVNKP